MLQVLLHRLDKRLRVEENLALEMVPDAWSAKACLHEFDIALDLAGSLGPELVEQPVRAQPSRARGSSHHGRVGAPFPLEPRLEAGGNRFKLPSEKLQGAEDAGRERSKCPKKLRTAISSLEE